LVRNRRAAVVGLSVDRDGSFDIVGNQSAFCEKLGSEQWQLSDIRDDLRGYDFTKPRSKRTTQA